MQVGVNTLGLLPERDSGEGIYVRRLLTTMRDIQSDVRFVLLTDEANHTCFEGWERVCTTATADQARSADSGFAEAIESATAELRVDILFSPLNTAPATTFVPLVLFAVDLQPWEEAATKGGRRGAQHIKLAKKVCSGASAIVAPSEYMRRRFLDLFGVAMDRVVVTPPGVDEVFGLPQPGLVQEPYFLAVGTTHAYKNIDTLIELFQRLSGEVPHGLVVVGQPGAAEPSEWGPRVLRIHHLPVAHLAGLYQHCDVFVCPSLCEDSGVTVLEAMRAGAPVVTGRVGGIPEVAGNTPIYCNPESVASMMGAVRRALYEDKSARAHRARLGKKQAAEYTWESCAWKTLRAFRHG